ncbi:hypothetical protein H0H92_010266 [Tricholoma furcatifolium]|nr:hypothetical protein H0H92_010266 [Tricholoma furcatifolium]
MSLHKPMTRSQQLTTSGLGKQFTSPIKRRDKAKTTTHVHPMGRKQQISRLKAQIDSLKRRASAIVEAPLTETIGTPLPPLDIPLSPPPPADMPLPPLDIPLPPPDIPLSLSDSGAPEDVYDTTFDDSFPGPDCVEDVERSPRRTKPNQAAKDLYSNWQNLLRRLVLPLLEYNSKTIGKIPERVSVLRARCRMNASCTAKKSEVLCLFQDSPSQPRMAVALHVLDFYRALFEKSCDAVHAMASALNAFYGWEQGSPIQDAFRRGLGYAAQWYDNLQIRVEQEVDAAVLGADIRIQQSRLVGSASTGPSESAPQHTPLLHPGECAWILQQRCPCCFGGELFGRPLEQEGGDIHVCLDGNFNHRHLRSAGDSPHFYDPSYILPKQFVDEVGAEMEKLRSAPQRRHPKAKVPDEAVDDCESSHVAGKGSNVKTNMERYDDGGLMALVCRHDIPIVLANIDTPGEQQKYAVAMLRWFFQLIPPQATVAALYDVGSCGRSRRLYIVDRHVASIGKDLRMDLGAWLRRRLSKNVETQENKAQKALKSCGVKERTLRLEWGLQMKAQLSIRAQAPMRLKKDLDTILSLQGDLETCEKSLQATRLTLSKSLPSAKSLRILGSLQDHHERLKDDIEELYSSLSIQETYPELRGVDLDFVKNLLVARDLKINIRKRAIGSFFEWERIDQASGGRDQVLGTKLHQATRAAIKKRAPALTAGLRKYNDLCATLATMYNPKWEIPLPEPLPTELRSLRDAPNLMEDVWISRPAERVPRWLSDGQVREGIRAMLKSDRCFEERRWLQVEANNLARWYGRELAALQLAVIEPKNLRADSHLQVPLQQRLSQLLSMRSHFSNPLTPESVFDTHVARAFEVAQNIQGGHFPPPLLIHEQDEGIEDNDGNAEGAAPSAEEVLFADYLEDVAEDDRDHAEPHPMPQQSCLLSTLAFGNPAVSTSLSHSRYFPHRRGRVVFSPEDLRTLGSSDGMLNDVCINGITTLLAQRFSGPSHPFFPSARRCAIFSTYDLPMMRNRASSEEIWRRTRHTEYWSRDVWILPIHHSATQHWVMCTIFPCRGEIFVFDSLARSELWLRQVQDVMSFVTFLARSANENGKQIKLAASSWIARPTVVQPRQSNCVDCGVWVIANIAAVLAGYLVTGVSEREIEAVRLALLRIVCDLPRCE